MEQCYLMPGQERCEKIKDANGVPKVSYSYRSLQGAFFHCVSRSVEEAQSRCEDIAVDFSHNGAQTTGENIAVGYADAASVIAAWQGSTGHYQNMINTVYTRGAIAHMYDGDGCHYWVAVFE